MGVMSANNNNSINVKYHVCGSSILLAPQWPPHEMTPNVQMGGGGWWASALCLQPQDYRASLQTGWVSALRSEWRAPRFKPQRYLLTALPSGSLVSLSTPCPASQEVS